MALAQLSLFRGLVSTRGVAGTIYEALSAIPRRLRWLTLVLQNSLISSSFFNFPLILCHNLESRSLHVMLLIPLIYNIPLEIDIIY